jgi:AAA+ ATPase superfamily predicted ATPase
MFRSDGIGEPDENDDGRLKFVGRFREREEIKTTLRKRKNRLVQISGAPNIGKQELTQQVLLLLLLLYFTIETKQEIIKIF